MTTTEERLAELERLATMQRRQLEEQATELADLRGRLDPSGDGPANDAATSTRPHSSRRTLFKTGLAAAGAAAAGPLLARPASAADGDPLRVGQETNSTSSTILATTGSSLFDDANLLTVSDADTTSSFEAAVGAYGQGQRVRNGLYAFASTRADADDSTGHAIIARPSGMARSHVYLPSWGGDPRETSYSHAAGELRQFGGDLWFCVQDGAPGVWRKISGELVAGALHVLAPKRVYDSRFVDGPLAAGSSRTISVADARDTDTGTITITDVVPEGATAIQFNVTITETVGGGFVGVGPGGSTTVEASTINWSATGQTLANGSLTTLDGGRQVTLLSGGVGSTQVVVDVTAYLL